MSIICAPKTLGFRATRPSLGISDDAERLATQERTIREDMFITNALSNYGLQDELLDLFSKHSSDNWDGYGAKAINHEALTAAFSFLLMLPTLGPTPELSVDPDGRVVFEWYRRPLRVFSVAIEKDGRLTYSGFFGVSQASGVESFENALPEEILRYIERVFS